MRIKLKSQTRELISDALLAMAAVATLAATYYVLRFLYDLLWAIRCVLGGVG